MPKLGTGAHCQNSSTRASGCLYTVFARSHACKQLTTAGDRETDAGRYTNWEAAFAFSAPRSFAGCVRMTEGGAEVVRLHQLEEDQLKDYRRRTRLYCMNGGHHLQILPDGRVQGQRDEEDVHSKETVIKEIMFCLIRVRFWSLIIIIIIMLKKKKILKKKWPDCIYKFEWMKLQNNKIKVTLIYSTCKYNIYT